jgi:YVTN family beta-propeller protein
VFALALGCAAPHSAPASPGTLVVLDKSDAMARFYDIAERKLLGTSSTGVGPHEVACRGGLAVVADYGEQTPGNTLTVLDARTFALVRTIDLGEHRRPHGIEWLDDRRVLVTVEQSQAILCVDVAAGAVEREMNTGQRASHMLVLAPDRQTVFVSNIASDNVTAVEVATGAVRAQIATGKGPEAIDVTPDGKEVWVGNRGGDTLTVIDARSLEVLATLPCAKFPIRLKVTPDGRHALVSCAQSGDLAVFDVAERREVRRIAMDLTPTEASADYLFGRDLGDGPLPIGILIHPSGERAWVANTNTDLVTELDLRSWTIAARIPTGRQPDGLGWSAPR